MAGVSANCTFAWVGLDEWRACVASLAEACSNAHLDLEAEIELTEARDALLFDGMRILTMRSETRKSEDGFRVEIRVRPTALTIAWAGLMLAQLPARASCRWVAGWPHFHCPPNDDRDAAPEPDGPVPGAELEVV